MNKRSLYFLGMGVGGTVGGFVPGLWGGGAFSGWGVLFSTVGGIVGIWGVYKITK